MTRPWFCLLISVVAAGDFALDTHLISMPAFFKAAIALGAVLVMCYLLSHARQCQSLKSRAALNLCDILAREELDDDEREEEGEKPRAMAHLVTGRWWVVPRHQWVIAVKSREGDLHAFSGVAWWPGEPQLPEPDALESRRRKLGAWREIR